MKGKFIVIDGVDGAGKTTQLALLRDWLVETHNKSVLVLDFPQYNEFWGKMVARFLSGEFGELDEVNPYLASLFYFLDQATRAGEIEAALDRGEWVLSNRYLSSSLVHQTAKIKTEAGKSDYQDWLVEAAYEKTGLYREDMVIALHVDPNISFQNAQASKARKNYAKRDIAEEDSQHQIDSAGELLRTAAKYPHWNLIECMEDGVLMSVTEIQDKIRQVLKPHLTPA